LLAYDERWRSALNELSVFWYCYHFGFEQDSDLDLKRTAADSSGPPITAIEAAIMVGHRHIPYLSFHKEVIREICRPQKDDLLIMAKGLGMRRVICALLKTYDRKEDLVLVVSLLSCCARHRSESQKKLSIQVNATPQDEAGIGDELGIMGVRDPGFRIMTYEMSVQQRCVHNSALDAGRDEGQS
jgi:hypothetical protein